MIISCGLVLTDRKHLLGVTPWGRNHQLDIPKGMLEEGKEPIDCAIREFKEETGIPVSKIQLEDLGLFRYTREKSLHLFLLKTRRLPPLSAMHCISFFKNNWGRLVPEVVAYDYVEFDDKRFYKSLLPVLKTIRSTL